MQLKNKIGVITGGNGRLGQIFADYFSKHNHIVVLDVEEASTQAPDGVSNFQADVTDQQRVKAVIDTIHKTHGTIDFLVNNAALQITKPYERTTVEDFRATMDVNLSGAYICTKAVTDIMIPKRQGCIVNIGSMYGVVSADPAIYGDSGLNSCDAYAASKGGLIQLTRYLAVNLAQYNIRVNAISPAGVFDHQPESFLSNYVPKVPLGRMMDRRELIGPLEFLLSDASSYVTGHNLMVDGGFTIK